MPVAAVTACMIFVFIATFPAPSAIITAPSILGRIIFSVIILFSPLCSS